MEMGGGYRITWNENGKKVNRKGAKDEFGNHLLTAKQAAAARNKALANRKESKNKRTVRKIFSDVFDEYCESGRKGKAYQTIRKQDSLWKNHLKERYGNRYVDEVSVAEISDYLSMLYHEEDRAYKYVESFLKMFYLIFGQAYSRN